MGIDAGVDDLYTSNDMAVEYLRERLPQVRRIFVLGTPSQKNELAGAGFEVSDDRPQAVVVGFDMTLTYERLCRAAWFIGQGLPFIATHPDRICPTDQPTVLVDCGSICATLTEATGKKPVVLGKPDPGMLTGILKRHGLSPAELAMVGDRLYTDMEMARRAMADVKQAQFKPDLVIERLDGLQEVLAKP
jgi:NagD protein